MVVCWSLCGRVAKESRRRKKLPGGEKSQRRLIGFASKDQPAIRASALRKVHGFMLQQLSTYFMFILNNHELNLVVCEIVEMLSFSRISTAESNFAFFLESHKCPDLYSAVVPRVTLEDNNDKMQQKHTTVEVARTYCRPFSSIFDHSK